MALAVPLLGAAVIALSGCGPDDTPAPVALPSPTGTSQPISRANLAHLWPLTIDAGTLTCRNRQDALFLASDVSAYALNDQARTDGYPSIDPLTSPGSHLGAMRSLALGLCENGS